MTLCSCCLQVLSSTEIFKEEFDRYKEETGAEAQGPDAYMEISRRVAERVTAQLQQSTATKMEVDEEEQKDDNDRKPITVKPPPNLREKALEYGANLRESLPTKWPAEEGEEMAAHVSHSKQTSWLALALSYSWYLTSAAFPLCFLICLVPCTSARLGQ